jgi:hypothetical protein
MEPVVSKVEVFETVERWAVCNWFGWCWQGGSKKGGGSGLTGRESEISSNKICQPVHL